MLTAEEQAVSNLWHARIGHQGSSILGTLNTHAQLGLTDDQISQVKKCLTCILTRPTRKAITRKGDEQYKSLRRIAVWSCDLVGPISVKQGGERTRCPTYDGYLYVLVLVEEYSHTLFTVLLKNKSDAADEIIAIFTYVKNLFQTVILRFRCDGGGEFLNNKFRDYLKCEGIQLSSTTADHPQHNGIVERMNRTLFELVRGLLSHSKAPLQLWGEAVKYATFIYNVTPHRVTEWVAPHTLLFGSTFNVNKLRVWGCDAYPKLLKPNLSKIQDQATRGIFLGYETINSSYRVLKYQPGFREVIIQSKDVEFIEDSFTQLMQLPKLYLDANADTLEFRLQLSDQQADDLSSDPDYVEESDKTNGNPRVAPLEPSEAKEETITTKDSDLNQLLLPVETAVVDGMDLITQPSTAGDAEVNAPHVARTSGKRQRRNPARSGANNQYASSILNNPENYDSDELFMHGLYAVESEEPETLMPLIETHPLAYEEVILMADTVTSSITKPLTVQEAPEEPLTYKDAVSAPDAPQWREAMQNEFDALTHLKVWKVVDRPPKEHKVLTGRWVYKCKLGDKNQLLKRKARYVVRGYLQVYGRDFFETHAPVAKMKSILMMLSLTAKDDLELHQLDFDTAFLNAAVKEQVYMEQPEGFKTQGKNKVLLLLKALYGLKQAPHEWNETINAFLKELGWRPLISDSCVYVKYSRNGRLMLLCLYVDDTVVCFHLSDQQEWFSDKQKISDKFAIKDLGECNWILNMKVIRDRSNYTLQLSQQAYVEKMVKTYGTNGIRNAVNPGSESLIDPPRGDKDIKLNSEGHELYRAIVGSLLYAANITRIDVCWTVAQLCRFTSNPSQHHLRAAYKVLKYLSDTSKLCLEFGKDKEGDNNEVVVFTDSDHAGDKHDRKSTSGAIVKFNGDIIKWASRKQKCVALSSMEAEFIAAGEAAKEALWVLSWIYEVFGTERTAHLICDNNSAIALGEKDHTHDKSKHIDIRAFFLRDEVKKNKITISWVKSSEQLADILTKPLDAHTHINLRRQLMGKIKSDKSGS